jgi:hypothetical protein
MAPVAFQQLAHPAGEIDTARAAQAMQSCMVSSTLSSVRMEDVATVASNGGSPRWFQLYFQPQQNDTLDLINRAVNTGYSAIVVTLDASIQAASLRAQRAGFRMPQDCVAANLRDHTAPANITLSPGESRVFQGIMRDAPTWKDLEWLMTQTSLPVWVKVCYIPTMHAHCKTWAWLASSSRITAGVVWMALQPASMRCLPFVLPSVPVFPYCLTAAYALAAIYSKPWHWVQMPFS